MKTFRRILLLVFVLALVAPMLITGPDGQRLVDWSDWLPGRTLGSGGEEQFYYKYRTDDGSWTYASEPPPDGIAYETVAVHTGANIVPAETPESMVQREKEGTVNPLSKLDDAKAGVEQFQQQARERDRALQQR